jgi:hypothetical protein
MSARHHLVAVADLSDGEAVRGRPGAPDEQVVPEARRDEITAAVRAQPGAGA